MKKPNTSPHSVATTITVLTATSCNTVKTYYVDAEGQLQCQQYGREMYFNYRLVPVQGIEQLASLLSAWSTQKNAILIRGTPRPGLSKLTDRKEANFPEAAEGCNWAMLDFDNISLPEGINPNSVDAIKYVVLKLPSEFHDASYFYQFSSSAGILQTDETPLKTGLNVHLFFWFKCPIHGKKLSAYFESHCYSTGFYKKTFDRSGLPVIKTGVDLSVIRSSVQPHYVGLPIIGKGVTSSLPVEARQGLLKKRNDAVQLPDLAASLIPEALSARKRLSNAWKQECGFTPTRITTRAAHGGISVSTYHRKPNGPSPSTNRVFLEAKSYGEKQDAVILYFEGEFSPGSFFVKKSRPQLAIRFGDGTSIPLKELSEGAYVHVRDELKWFSEIAHVELPLTETGYVPDFRTFCTSKYSLIVAPTGTGKTTSFVRYARSKSVIIIYAAQTIALVDQMYAELIKNGKLRVESKSWQFNVPWAVRYTDFHKGAILQEGVVYVTTNESLSKFIEAAITQGVSYELVIDEIHVALDDFMANNAKNELLERAIGRACRGIFMTGTITHLQISKLLDTISRSCGPQTPEIYSGYQFHPVKSNPLFIADVSKFGADFVALMRQYSQLKKEGKPIPRTVIITPSTRMKVFELLLEKLGLLADSCVVSRQESFQEDIEKARTSGLPILISSPLFALGLNFDFEATILWTFFSYLQVDESQIIQTLNRANRGRVQCEVRLYVGETDERPVMIPDAVVERLKVEEYLQDETSVQGLLDAHFHVDRVMYLSLREAEKKTAKSLHRLIKEDTFQNYHVQDEWVDTLGATRDDRKLFTQFKRLARQSYLDDVNEHAEGHDSRSVSLLLYQLEKLYQKKKEFGDAVDKVQRGIENMERGVCMVLCNVSAAESAPIKPARLRRLFGDLKPYLTAQYSHEKTGEWRAAAAEKTLALIPLLEALKKMKNGQMTGHTFATLMKRPVLGGAARALADSEKNLIDWQKRLDRLDEISNKIRTRASDSQKVELKAERFDVALDFLKTIGVTFGTVEVNDKEVINPHDPKVPNWDFDRMLATLYRRAASLERLPVKPMNKEFEALSWVDVNISKDLCVSCVHCSHDLFCELGRPIQPFWDDIEPTTLECDAYRKISAKLDPWEPTKN